MFKTTVADITKANPSIKDPNLIHVGTVLKVPDYR
ncbi:MAG: LysM peptidoglycan-binding domain-containing protein [Christensenella sp.]|nr:LysM peptidoglycan-binding domain-containing protein [Christensenella sp.]